MLRAIMSTIVHSLRDYRAPTRAQQFALSFNLPLDEVPYVDAAGNRADILSAILSLANPTAGDGPQEDLVFVGRLTSVSYTHLTLPTICSV